MQTLTAIIIALMVIALAVFVGLVWAAKKGLLKGTGHKYTKVYDDYTGGSFKIDLEQGDNETWAGLSKEDVALDEEDIDLAGLDLDSDANLDIDIDFDDDWEAADEQKLQLLESYVGGGAGRPGGAAQLGAGVSMHNAKAPKQLANNAPNAFD